MQADDVHLPLAAVPGSRAMTCTTVSSLVSLPQHSFVILQRWCCRYGDGTVRLTVEQNLLFPNVPEDRLDEMRQVNITSNLNFTTSSSCSAPLQHAGWAAMCQTGHVYAATAVAALPTSGGTAELMPSLSLAPRSRCSKST